MNSFFIIWMCWCLLIRGRVLYQYCQRFPQKKHRKKTQTTQCPNVSAKKIQSTHYDSVASIAPTGAEASSDVTCRAISLSDGLKRENALALPNKFMTNCFLDVRICSGYK